MHSIHSEFTHVYVVGLSHDILHIDHPQQTSQSMNTKRNEKAIRQHTILWKDLARGRTDICTGLRCSTFVRLLIQQGRKMWQMQAMLHRVQIHLLRIELRKRTDQGRAGLFRPDIKLTLRPIQICQQVCRKGHLVGATHQTHHPGTAGRGYTKPANRFVRE